MSTDVWPYPYPQITSMFPKRISGATMEQAALWFLTNVVVGINVPHAPIFNRKTKVAAIGSCFAEEIAKQLTADGLNVDPIFLSEDWNSAFALQRFVAFLLNGTPFTDGSFADPTVLKAITKRKAKLDAECIILSLGLSLCWFEKRTGKLVIDPGHLSKKGGWKAFYDRYEMRQTSVAENEAAIMSCVETIRAALPNSKIILTLSPVPLLMALNGNPIIQANAVSKSVLRVALDNVMSRKFESVYYWPSYEFVTNVGAHMHATFIGLTDLRHVRPEIVRMATSYFQEIFFSQ